MDRVTAMRVFADVAASGSFSASAERLEMSRAMVTRYVAEMEQWLGARLLQRTTRRVTLTDAGEQALRRCLQMLALVAEVEDEVAPADAGLRGQLRLTSSMSFGHAHLAAALAEFLVQHPQLKIDLNVGDATLNLVEARIDLAIRISSEPDPALIARPLTVCDSVLVASPGYLAAAGTPQTPTALAGHRCLGHSNVGRSSWRFLRGETQETVNVATRFTANDATVLLHAALADGGISLQPTYLANPWLQRGELLAVLPDWQPPPMTIYALYPSRRHLSPAVRALLDFLVARFTTLRW
ncbi:LysR substrate-binding domain-containing protein [Vogesella indigofera]|uniref:LysR substrate-binding domain-containing protein n=1 Tax=Vogesella indigofera TaxID=45465 RepID=UPI00234E5C1F|nr:LysR substrate-binding domain-containing protein [Vogesella indigofera]MDC7709736.1 LysR substrate-binding domain-containing protein [Vogesella indigofera]